MVERVPIKTVVVLMLENGSFDHMFGFWPTGDPLSGHEFNLVDPGDPRSDRVYVSRLASTAPPFEAPHDLLCVNTQLFGDPGAFADPAPLNGFVKAAIAANGATAGQPVMDCFDPQRLPTLQHLAEQFCLCTRWFASVPGPTWPNRLFAHAANSDGVVSNAAGHPFLIPTIYQKLAAAGHPWRVYFHDFPQVLALRGLWTARDCFRPFEQYLADAAAGRLPSYSWIEPRYFDSDHGFANDGHPPHDLRYTEHMIADVYEALRNGPQWESSLLLVTFDEHGGYYDHVSPPADAVPPDGKRSAKPPFGFDRLGLRVPALLISPWIAAGTVDTTRYEHASIPATLERLFDLKGHLSARDAVANTFDRALTLNSPRSGAGAAPLRLRRPDLPAPTAGANALKLAVEDALGDAAADLGHALTGAHGALLVLAHYLLPELDPLLTFSAELIGHSPCAEAAGPARPRDFASAGAGATSEVVAAPHDAVRLPGLAAETPASGGVRVVGPTGSHSVGNFLHRATRHFVAGEKGAAR